MNKGYTSFLLSSILKFLPFDHGYLRTTILKILVYLPLILAFLLLTDGCKKNSGCISIYTLPTSPYSDPVWFPDGSLLGFNHIPIQSIGIIDQSPCPATYNYSYYEDSAGFWLISANGTNMRRATFFQLQNPAWSPDGKWISFSNGGQIYKMPFDGQNFDTAHIIQLTIGPSNHFFPSWNQAGDTIYFDSDMDNQSLPYQVYKMAHDGTGQQVIGNKGVDSSYSREPFYISREMILHIRGDTVSTHVYTMDTNGNSVKQLTSNVSTHIYIHNPSYFNQKIYFEDYGVWSSNMDGSDLQEIALNSTQGFSISNTGMIAYVNLDLTDGSPNSIIDQTHGTIWLMKADGSQKVQFTFNIY